MTPQPSYKTIKLSVGKHSTPEKGACVMELASMIAGEAFTDRPRSVCPVISDLLRSYNDAIDDQRRQSLYEYAVKVVGTRATREIELARSERIIDWANEMSPRFLWLSECRSRRLVRKIWRAVTRHGPDIAGAQAIVAVRRHINDDRTHTAVLALIDELIAIGADRNPITEALASPAAEPVVAAV